MSKVDESHPVVQVIDEIIRTGSRLRVIFQDASIDFKISKMELMVLTAVVIADRPPTVPQIGRSLGCARQVVQRAANKLFDDGLICSADNPDHKTAKLLIPTPQGIKIKSQVDQRAIKSADEILEIIDVKKCEKLTKDLRSLRREIESYIKGSGKSGSKS